VTSHRATRHAIRRSYTRTVATVMPSFRATSSRLTSACLAKPCLTRRASGDSGPANSTAIEGKETEGLSMREPTTTGRGSSRLAALARVVSFTPWPLRRRRGVGQGAGAERRPPARPGGRGETSFKFQVFSFKGAVCHARQRPSAPGHLKLETSNLKLSPGKERTAWIWQHSLFHAVCISAP